MTALRHRMLEDMQVRNLSPHTQRGTVKLRASILILCPTCRVHESTAIFCGSITQVFVNLTLPCPWAQELAMTVFDEQTGGPPRGRWHPGSHSHRNTRDAISVQMANTTTRAATSPTWADQVLPCQIPESNDTA